jgi:mRNA interferase RelE/StbE
LEIIYARTAVKTIRKMEGSTKRALREGIEGLKEVPPKGDIKPLQGLKPAVYRLRVGKYRVIFEYMDDENKTLFIKDIGSRGDVYK